MTVQTLPTAAEVTSGTQTNAQQKTDFASLFDFLLAKLGKLSGQGPQTVASAATLDLDAVTDTRDLVISGTTTITAVTVEAGKVFRCRASGAFTLTNNANIVTNYGADIVCAAGDSFTLRATAANTVEVIGLSGKITAARLATAVLPLGVGQTWQNLIGSRTNGVIYTNNTGRPIFVQADLYSTAGTLLTLYVYPGGSIPAGVEVDVTQMAANVSGSVGGIVPDGDSYQVANTAGTPTVYRWAELR